jgi:hypothetical protein
MRSNRLWIGATCGVALALGAVVAVDAGTQTAGAQANSTVSPEQLKINQNISSAAVRRSNRSLKYLAPTRTTQSANAHGSNGDPDHLWARLGPEGGIIASSGPPQGDNDAYTRTKAGVGRYRVNFRRDVSACSWSASPYFPPNTTLFYATLTKDTGDVNEVGVWLFQVAKAGGPLSDALTDNIVGGGVSVQVDCGKITPRVAG